MCLCTRQALGEIHRQMPRYILYLAAVILNVFLGFVVDVSHDLIVGGIREDYLRCIWIWARIQRSHFHHAPFSGVNAAVLVFKYLKDIAEPSFHDHWNNKYGPHQIKVFDEWRASVWWTHGSGYPEKPITGVTVLGNEQQRAVEFSYRSTLTKAQGGDVLRSMECLCHEL